MVLVRQVTLDMLVNHIQLHITCYVPDPVLESKDTMKNKIKMEPSLRPKLRKYGETYLQV